MNYLKRLSDIQTHNDGPLPWLFKPSSPLPEEVRENKKERDTWINRPDTDWQVYSFWEGVNPNLRVSKPKKDGEGNPPLLLSAAVGDYDSNMEESVILDLASKLPFVPNWIERTLSGNWRFVWLFEKPIRVPSYSFALHFLTTFPDFAFDPSRGAIGFDQPAWNAPERYYTNSCDWRPLNPNPIPENVTEGWLIKASGKFEFSQQEFGTAIPLEIVKDALAAKYPSFSEWPGEFVEGAHGPTFWVPASKSPKSATVYPNGLRTFSENATKTFYSWAELLGVAFVKEHEAESCGKAAKDIAFDGKLYWRRFPDGVWRCEESAVLSRHLIVQREVAKTVTKDNPIAEVDRILDYITGSQRVEAALPAVFRPSGLWTDDAGRRLLNTSRVQVLQPAEGVAIWGPDGQLPWLSRYFDGTYCPEQARVLMAWLVWGYRHAYKQTPRSGQILFVAGPVNVGKTLLSRGILGRLFGGVAEAASWLMGDSNFNGELMGSGMWVVDDNNPSSDPGNRKRWSYALKKVAANRDFQYNEKFKQAGMTEWLGRVCVTMNCDPESIRLLPDLDISSLDKCIIIRTLDKAAQLFPEDLDEILDRELPWLARHLLQQEIPEDLKGESRFGIKAYADQSLIDSARQSSQQAGFSELMENWKAGFFKDNPDATYWEGTATELYMDMGTDPRRNMALAKLSADAVGRHLSAMFNKGVIWLQIVPRASGTRGWRIHKDEINQPPPLDIEGETK